MYASFICDSLHNVSSISSMENCVIAEVASLIIYKLHAALGLGYPPAP